MADIVAALTDVRGRIAEACRKAGRAPEDVTLVAVSKTHPAEAVAAAMEEGQLVFGENRVQEAAAKFATLREGNPTLRLHIIGGLQTNKAEEAVRVADMIETLDRPKLADALARASDKTGILPELLVQVNIGDEAQKSGCPTADAGAFIEACAKRFGPKLKGLMCIPPADEDPVRFFRALATMAKAHGLPIVSMGMSGDFETAIEHGATHVRVGSAIFGHRPKA